MKKKKLNGIKADVTRSKFGKKKSNITHEEWAKRFDIAYNKIKIHILIFYNPRSKGIKLHLLTSKLKCIKTTLNLQTVHLNVATRP